MQDTLREANGIYITPVAQNNRARPENLLAVTVPSGGHVTYVVYALVGVFPCLPHKHDLTHT